MCVARDASCGGEHAAATLLFIEWLNAERLEMLFHCAANRCHGIHYAPGNEHRLASSKAAVDGDLPDAGLREGDCPAIAFPSGLAVFASGSGDSSRAATGLDYWVESSER